MKNDMKIILGAIVVILLLLVGAYALSGSNSPQPTATPTVTPVTATPTPVPGGSTPTAAPTVAPTIAPTATPEPTVTPTPVPESGVKLTEFGYWITYPPLGPQKWSTNPRPNPNVGNVVYFNTTYGTMALNDDLKANGWEWDGDYYEAMVYRNGNNLSETVTVTIHMTTSSNIAWAEYGWDNYGLSPVSLNYMASMHGDDDDVFADLGDGYYELTFEPGVTEQYVCIHVDPYYIPDPSPTASRIAMPEGWVKLTITGADNGYGVDGSKKDFLLDIKELPIVYFDSYEGYIWSVDGVIHNSTYDFGSVDASGDIVYVTVPVIREGSEGTLNVYFDWHVAGSSGDPFPADALTIIQPLTFTGSQYEGYVTLGIDKDVLLDGNNKYYIAIYIEDSVDYIADDEFYLQVNYAELA